MRSVPNGGQLMDLGTIIHTAIWGTVAGGLLLLVLADMRKQRRLRRAQQRELARLEAIRRRIVWLKHDRRFWREGDDA